MAVFVGRLGIIAVPAAFALTASLETIALTVVLLTRIFRLSAGLEPIPALR